MRRASSSKVGHRGVLFEMAHKSLVAKFQELQSSLVAAQRQSRDLASENGLLETRATEAFDQLEMAALDREVAEEKAEAADLEVEKLGEKISELELEVALLKEENGKFVQEVGYSLGTYQAHSRIRQTWWHGRRRKKFTSFCAARET